MSRRPLRIALLSLALVAGVPAGYWAAAAVTARPGPASAGDVPSRSIQIPATTPAGAMSTTQARARLVSSLRDAVAAAAPPPAIGRVSTLRSADAARRARRVANGGGRHLQVALGDGVDLIAPPNGSSWELSASGSLHFEWYEDWHCTGCDGVEALAILDGAGNTVYQQTWPCPASSAPSCPTSVNLVGFSPGTYSWAVAVKLGENPTHVSDAWSFAVVAPAATTTTATTSTTTATGSTATTTGSTATGTGSGTTTTAPGTTVAPKTSKPPPLASSSPPGQSGLGAPGAVPAGAPSGGAAPPAAPTGSTTTSATQPTLAPAPSSPATQLGLKLAAWQLSPLRPRPGGLLTAAARVQRADNGNAVTVGTISCRATARGRALAVVSKGFVGGRARCVWRLPRRLHRARVAGALEVTLQGVRVTRSFATRSR